MASGAWGKVRAQPVQICSLSDVMSEELAVELQKEEDKWAASVAQKKEEASAKEKAFFAQHSREDGDTSNDFELARLLQAQFDAEAESERKDAPVTLPFNFTSHGEDNGGGKGEEEEEEDEEDDEVYSGLPGPSFTCGAGRGYSGSGANIRTKHDLEVSARRNADRILDCMDLSMATGDVGSGEHRISSHVFNGLRRVGQSEQRRTARLQEKKDRSTAERAVDERTRNVLYRLEARDRLRELGGVVATGKESIVLHALGGSACNAQGTPFPDECAVKVYKTTLNEFKSRVLYVNGDFRFSRDEFKKQNPRKVVRMWAEKEMMNLKKIYSAGILCPKPILLTRNLLIMSFIGSQGFPACQLKDADLSPAELEIAFDQTVTIMRRLLNECSLVHADLSCYNLLWHADNVWVIDVSQSVDRVHPHALSFLRRDCENVCSFFERQGVASSPGWEALFNDLTGLQLAGLGKDFLKSLANHLAATQDFEASREWLSFGESRRDFAFDFFFEATRKEEEEEVAVSSSSVPPVSNSKSKTGRE